MSYTSKIKLINLRPEVSLELQKRAQKAAQWSAKKQDLSKLPIEMQIAQKYLELATHKEKYRFNDAEVAELMGSMTMYRSQTPVNELVKQLLNIGVENNKPLSAKEMKDFFAATAIMNAKGQGRVIKFMESLKEIDQNNPKEAAVDKTDGRSDLIPYKAYTSMADTNPNNISNFINLKNLTFVYSVANCQKPEILAKIAHRTGISHEVEDAPNLFVQMYELSDGNLDLIQDLSRCFYFWEIEQIASKLTAQGCTKDLAKYTSRTYSTDYHTLWFSSPGLAVQKDRVIQGLGLTGQVDLSEVSTNQKVKTYDGSFEQGKRR